MEIYSYKGTYAITNLTIINNYLGVSSTVLFVVWLQCLQVMMQPVLESLIINDRVAFLKEHGLAAKSVAIFSENISPRNIAIVASKN